MKAIITITKNSRQPSEYLYSVKKGSFMESRRSAGFCKGAAAATAVEKSILHGAGGFVIFAPDDILKLIPAEMRSE